jgi:hypothetical protein
VVSPLGPDAGFTPEITQADASCRPSVTSLVVAAPMKLSNPLAAVQLAACAATGAASNAPSAAVAATVLRWVCSFMGLSLRQCGRLKPKRLSDTTNPAIQGFV